MAHPFPEVRMRRTKTILLSLTAGLWLVGPSTLSAETPPPALRIQMVLRADQARSVINPNLYGQFAEHLGHGIYGGIWVGEKSRIPNTRGRLE